MSGGELKRVKGQEKNLFGRWATDLIGDMGINWANWYLHNNDIDTICSQQFHINTKLVGFYQFSFRPTNYISLLFTIHNLTP